MAPSLSEFKECLDNAFSLISGGPVRSRELDLIILMCPFQPKTLCDSSQGQTSYLQSLLFSSLRFYEHIQST